MATLHWLNIPLFHKIEVYCKSHSELKFLAWKYWIPPDKNYKNIHEIDFFFFPPRFNLIQISATQ